jgi:hypothetical protein
MMVIDDYYIMIRVYSWLMTTMMMIMMMIPFLLGWKPCDTSNHFGSTSAFGPLFHLGHQHFLNIGHPESKMAMEKPPTKW